MKFMNFFISFCLIGIFILCMVNFNTQISSDNNSTNTVLQNPAMAEAFSGLESNLSEFQKQAEDEKGIFEENKPMVGIGFFMLEGIMGAGKIFTGMIISVFNFFLLPLGTILGIDTGIISIFISILIVSILLLLWRLYKAGE